MARLTYLAIASLDGYIEDEQGKFDWAEPDLEIHSFVNDLARSWGTQLCGRPCASHRPARRAPL